MFRTSNPAFSRNEAYQPAQTWDDLADQGRIDDMPAEVAPSRASAGGKVMTVQGAVNKSFFLLALCTTTAIIGWNITTSADPIISPMWLLLGGGLGGLLVSLVCIFAPKTTPVTAPLYATLEGFFLGAISAFYAQRFGDPTPAAEGGKAVALNTGLIFNAILLTFGITGGMLVGYTTKLIRPGPVFRNGVIAATLGVCLYGLIAFVAAMFGAPGLASVYDPSNGGLVSIGFSAFVVLLASANLILDFDMIHNAARSRAPRYMEWYSAFGLMVTLVWLYLEVLRLLAKLQSRE